MSTLDLERWTKEVAPYIKAHLDAGLGEEEAIANGMRDYTAFLAEMHAGVTPRAKLARQVLTAVVYRDCGLIGEMERIVTREENARRFNMT